MSTARTKAVCEKVYRLLRLKVHFHGRGNDDTVVNPDYCFIKFNRKIFTSTPPEGEFSAVDHYIDRCRRSVGALNFEAKTFYNNLPQVEKEALKNLLKRDDIVIKPILVTSFDTFKRHYDNYRTVVFMSVSTRIF